MPNDDTTKKVTDDNSPIFVQEESLPPTLQDNPIPQMTDQPQPATAADPVAPVTSNDLPTQLSDTGSAAPSDDVVMPPIVTSKQKKKFAGGRVIATILGLFLLVGGLGAGILLVQQDQNIAEKADYGSCYDDCRAEGKGNQVCMCRCDSNQCYRDDSPGTTNPGGPGCSDNTNNSSCNSACSPDGYACVWRSDSSSCNTSAQPCSGSDGTNEEITGGNCTTEQNSSGIWSQCGSGTGGSECTFCLKAANRTCNDILQERQCYNITGGNCGTITGTVTTYYCQGSGELGDTNGVPNGCQNNDPLPGGVSWNDTSKSITGSFCGVVQVDAVNNSGFCSRTDTSGCSVDEPTTPPTVTAQCQSITLYDKDWAIVGQQGNVTTVEDKMEAGEQLNFCVAGSTSAGAFDSAKFLVNGVAQAVTTTKHPTLDQFCQVGYVIPAGVRQFTIAAQIHHSTLGWK